MPDPFAGERDRAFIPLVVLLFFFFFLFSTDDTRNHLCLLGASLSMNCKGFEQSGIENGMA